MDSPACQHKRLRTLGVILRDQAEAPQAVSFSVACAECGQSFRFAGVESSSTVLVSEDRQEIRLLIIE
jgi:hypothetical protein